MIDTVSKTRGWMLGVIIILVIIIIIFSVGVPAWKGNCSSEGYSTNLTISPKVDTGVSYTNYDFWSLYGWRTNPPPGYPQETLVTPFNTTMNECQNWCNNVDNPEECLRKCRFAALKASGYHPTNDQLYNPPTIDSLSIAKEVKNSKEEYCGCSGGEIQTYSQENYSPVSRSLPSHTAPQFRRSLELPPDIEKESGFCFYR